MFWWLSLNSALASRLIHIDDPHISMQLFESECELFHFNCYRHPNFKQSSMGIWNQLLWINYTELRKWKSLLQIQSFKKLLQNNKWLLCFILFSNYYVFYSTCHTCYSSLHLIRFYWRCSSYANMLSIACTVCFVRPNAFICLLFLSYNLFFEEWCHFSLRFNWVFFSLICNQWLYVQFQISIVLEF